MMSYYIYLLRCQDGSLYAGSCKDLHERERIHNTGKGAKYTRSRLPVHIVYSEEYATRSEALKREAEVKRLSKESKEHLTQKIDNNT
ncbi:hypothetical protein COU79_03650 [Candidatus Peregrinibacteria bacterium CG10_big_fil_rev_8_21_14_0_10_54_7]|nr:MAG: hypothetical protein COW95_01585 [Candidatus Peregrinibacteria bacterium CG22_combo_CG10-13_8_21_14_all_49_11]PIR49664.1 MAG: hypothetical protein COU79_03650 [Candidatus Peregrinibacteria bacterium CG10_big_fil_rev_8_21_14_0_10_54_7]